MQQHDIKQGSPEWLSHRAQCWNASDAPAMMGESPYKTRAQLIREVATGLAEDVDAQTQRLFDEGHRIEALTRPRAEAIVGDDLSPLIGSTGVVGLTRRVGASFDGLTFMRDTNWEHKTLNEALRAVLPAQGIGDESVGARLPLGNRIQMEQQMLVSRAGRSLFSASKWEGDKLVEERHCWYVSDPELRAKIIGGWKQFEIDVAAYKPAEVVAEVVADPVELLPAVVVKVSGELSVVANLGAYETKLRDFLENRLIRKPKTDLDFVNLDAQIKLMKTGREAIKGAKAQALGQAEPVDVFCKTADMLDDLLQKACSAAERTLKDEKERRKTDIVLERQAALREHCDTLTKRVGVLVTAAADFGGAIRNLKSLASMEDKLDTELARAKIAASTIADLIDGNRKVMESADAAGLFPDFTTVCTKAAEDFANLVASRKAAAEAAQAARLEAERAKIRAEEEAKAKREAEAKVRAEAEAKAREEAAAQAQRDAEARAAAQAEAQRLSDALAASRVESEQSVKDALSQIEAAKPAPAPQVRAFTPRAAAPVEQAEPYTVRLGEIQALIAPYTITAEGIAQEGFQFRVERGMKFYRQSDARALCLKASKHFAAKAEELLQAA